MKFDIGDIVQVLRQTEQPDGFKLAFPDTLVGLLGTIEADCDQWPGHWWVCFDPPINTYIQLGRDCQETKGDSWAFLEDDIQLVFSK